MQSIRPVDRLAPPSVDTTQRPDLIGAPTVPATVTRSDGSGVSADTRRSLATDAKAPAPLLPRAVHAIDTGAATYCPRGHFDVVSYASTRPPGPSPLRSRSLESCPRVPASAPSVRIDPSRTFQAMEGFGAALTESSAEVLMGLSPAQRHEVLRQLFDPTSGFGLSVLRLPLGASDFSLKSYSYADVEGPTDLLEHFSIAHDERSLIPILHEILAINPSVEVIGTAWAPPAWMTTHDPAGHRVLRPEHLATYATYLRRTVEAYAALQPPIVFRALTVQNEPYYDSPSYPTLYMPRETQRAFIAEHLGPALHSLRARGLAVELYVHDHNWDRWEDAAALVDDPEVRRYTDGVAFHGYAGSFEQQSRFAARHPDVPIYFTESTGMSWDETTVADDLQWDMHNLLLGAVRHGARTVLKWNLALDEHNGPQNGGCNDCRGMLTIGPARRGETQRPVAASPELYAFGLVAKNVQRGARHIAAEVDGGAELDCVAFANPDGSLVLLARNPLGHAQPFSVRTPEGTIDEIIPPGAAVALRWWPSGSENDRDANAPSD